MVFSISLVKVTGVVICKTYYCGNRWILQHLILEMILFFNFAQDSVIFVFLRRRKKYDMKNLAVYIFCGYKKWKIFVNNLNLKLL